MTLSEYEEMVVAHLEEQFSDHRPGSNRMRFGLPAAIVLAGVALFLAAHHGPLLIWLSDLLGYPTAGITSTLSLGGYGLLLVSAFLLGHALRDVRVSPAADGATARTPPTGAATPR